MGQACCTQEDADAGAADVSSAVTSLPALNLAGVQKRRENQLTPVQAAAGFLRSREASRDGQGPPAGKAGPGFFGSAAGGPKVREFTAALDKSRSEKGVALGVDVELSDDEAFLTVVRITGGVVAAWNAMHPDKQLKLGDRIVAVNGLSGDGALMTHLVQSADLVELLVQSRVEA